MSVASDLQSAFAERSITRPVLFGAQTTRGILDKAGTLKKVGDFEMSVNSEVLYVQTGTLTDPGNGDEVTVGAIGAESAVGGTRYRVNDVEAIDDGEITAIAVAGGST